MKSQHVGTRVPSGDKKLSMSRVVVMADESLGYLGRHMLPAWRLNSGYYLLCILEGTQTALWESGDRPPQPHVCEQSYLRPSPSKGS